MSIKSRLGIIILILAIQVSFYQFTFALQNNLNGPNTQKSDEEYPQYTLYLVVLDKLKDYELARGQAEIAAAELNLRLDFRGLQFHPDSDVGLSHSREKCKDYGGAFPCYYDRDELNSKGYISIEYSNRYEKINPNYYLIVAKVFDKKDKAQAYLKKSQFLYPKAFLLLREYFFYCRH